MPAKIKIPISVSVLISDEFDAVQVFVSRRHDLHDVLVRLEPGRVELVSPSEGIERPDAL